MLRFVSVLAALAAATSVPADEIAPGVELVRGTFVAGTQPDGNTLILAGTTGLVVFDTGRHREHAQKIVDFANARGARVEAIVNSHWHLDHVGGNVLLRKAFPEARVYASGAIDDARHGFLATYRSQLEGAIKESASDAAKQDAYRAEIGLIDAGDALAPDERIETASTRTLAGRKVRIGVERNAVTAGDVWLFDAKTRTLASGDLVTLPAPLLDTACPERWRAALARLETIDFKTLVPGHGAPMRRGDFATYRHAFDRLLACAASDSPKDACVDGWMRDAHALIPERDRELARGLLGYYVEASLRAPAEKTRALCGG